MDDDVLCLPTFFDAGKSHTVHVYRRTGYTWLEEAVLSKPDDLPEVQFGSHLHVHGEWLAVSDHFNSPGYVYIFRHIQKNWTHVQTLDAPENAIRFGQSIDIDGDRMIVGAPFWQPPGSPPFTLVGRAYIFELANDKWVLTAELSNPEPQPFSLFGQVALDGDRAVVGASAAHDFAGRAHVFEKIDSEWLFAGTLTPDPPGLYGLFGNRVAAAQGVIAVGAHESPNHGRVYVFGPGDQSTYVQGAEMPIVLPSPIFQNVKFGSRMDLHSSAARIATGAHLDAEAGIDAGAGFLLQRTDGKWRLQKKLIGSHTQAGDGATAEPIARDATVLVAHGKFHIYAGVLQSDCLGTGQPDACDIFDGLAEDSTGSGIPDECEFAGDLNGDGAVDVDDLLILLSLWGECEVDPNTDPDSPPDSPAGCFGDISHDGQVGIDDLLILLANWG